MAKRRIPRPGDIVTWMDPETMSHYTPGPPYVVVDHHGHPKNALLRTLDGKKVYFDCCGSPMEHQGVSIDDIRVDTFLNAARKANLEKKPDGET